MTGTVFWYEEFDKMGGADGDNDREEKLQTELRGVEPGLHWC